MSWSDDWKVEVSKLLKKRGFREEEEGQNWRHVCLSRPLVVPPNTSFFYGNVAGLKYHTTTASGEEIAIKDILKDKTATLESKHFPISLHLEASNVTASRRENLFVHQS